MEMKLGLHVSNFTWPGGPTTIARDLARVAKVADEQGFTKLSVMDHVWQISAIGPPEHDMLEAYTTLGFLAGQTERIELLAWVTAAVYRDPALLAKAVTTLDVLSGGRAWYEAEARGLGLSFPSTAERFERLEETLQICLQMWSDDDAPFSSKHYALERTLNAPQSLSRPHPPILIGGGGETKTLRLVARYADACNLGDGPDVGHKLEVLRRHCDAVGRDYDSIEKTVIGLLDPGPEGENLSNIIDSMRALANLGVTHFHGSVPNDASIAPIEILGQQVIPIVEDF
jgi:alkanesulfonate monooxygenase